jgi:branched-chain amino acid transport system permease protein
MLGLILSQAASGLTLGVVYVLIAIGLSITFGLLGVINFAHGAFFALGAYLAYALQGWWGVQAIWLAPLLVAAVGMVLERLLLRHLYQRNPLTSLIVTFALALFIEALIRRVWGSAGVPFNAPEALQGVLIYGPFLITTYRLAVVACTLLLLCGLWLFLGYTPYGRILRAGSRDPEMVEALGIRLQNAQTGAFGLGCGLAAVAGVLAAPLWSVSPSMGSEAIMPAFVVITIGGLGSLRGSIVSGVLVGVVTALTIQFAPAAAGAAMYVLMLLVTLVRPRGLFGEHWERFE